MRSSLTCSRAHPCSLVWRISLLDSCSQKAGLWDLMFRHRDKEAQPKEKAPELFGVALLNLRPLLYKFDVELQQVDARLRVLFDLVALVL